MLNLCPFIFNCSYHPLSCLGIICLGTAHFLVLSIDILKMRLAARECIQKQPRMVYQAYVQNDTKIVVLVAL